MPELPEVETVAKSVHARAAGETIVSVWLGEKPEPLKSPAAEIEQALVGSTIKQVRRVGKHIVADLEPAGGSRKNMPPRQWIVHLGMSGKLLVVRPDEAVAKHTHAIVRLDSGKEIRFVDPRRFGRLSVDVSGQGFAGPGTEPLDIPLDDFVALFRKRKVAIKAALLNQKLLQGVGNIYADESLFGAGIRPRRRAASLTREEAARLHKELKRVLKQAIRLKGSSVSDYVDADGVAGSAQTRHRVYMRTGEPCVKCKTPIKRIVVSGRSTHYCPRCQK